MLVLYNLDGSLRDGFAGLARLGETVEPGQVATLGGSVKFPDKVVPFLISGQFKSYGIDCAHDADVTWLRKVAFRGRRQNLAAPSPA